MLSNTRDFFQVLESCFDNYYHFPDSESFLLLAMLLYHLREHIVDGKKWKKIVKIPDRELTKEERFFLKIYTLDEFEIVSSICNGSKHRRIEESVEKLEGATCGVTACSDFLGQKYIMIDGKDSREIFRPVFQMYKNFFNEG